MRRLAHTLGPLIVLALVTGAGYLLFREIHHFRWRELVESIAEISPRRVAAAVVLTVLSYGILAGYDLLALEYAGRRLPLSRTVLISFISFTTSYNFGALLGGTSMRYRLYTTSGLASIDVMKIALSVGYTFWLGAAALGSVVFLAAPLPLPEKLRLPVDSTRPLGFLLLSGLVLCFAVTLARRQPVRFRGWQVTLPSFRLSLAQLVVAVADLVVAGSIPYVLLAPMIGVGFLGFLGAWILGIWLTVMTHVPGGIGVLELTLFWFLEPTDPHAALAALLVFRFIYYLVPLLVAAGLMVGRESLAHREHLQRVWSALSGVAVVIPPIASLLVFAAGVVLLASGAIPGRASRLTWIHQVVPLPLLEASHFFGSVVGAALLILAWGLRRRLDSAYWIAVMLLALGVAVSLVKGLDYEAALFLGGVLLVLAASRRHFYRRGSLLNDPLTPGWLISIGVALVAAGWLALFVHRHVAYRDELWWSFSLRGEASRALRGMVGAVAVVFLFALARVMRAARPRPEPVPREQLDAIARIVERSPATYAHLAFLGDKRFLLNDPQTAFIMYGVQGGSWIAMGDPVGPPDQWPDLAWRFRELCDLHAANTVFYQTGAEHLPIYIDLGLSLLKLGEEARVPLEHFSPEGASRKALRQSYHRIERQGCVLEVAPRENVMSLLPELRAVSDAWLRTRHASEKGFSLGFFDEAYLARCPVAIVRQGSEVIAFSNLWLGAERQELSADLIRYVPDAVSGVMEALLVGVMLWGKEQGYRWFNLGMAPLAGLETHPLAPLWNRVGDVLFEHGEHFYNFRGLRQYKQKFDPVWQPRYLAARGGLALPRILTDVATLISGGLKGLLTK
jgi:phosphatidylglycerol lysyltransferase